MKGLLYSIGLQWKLNFRDKEIVTVYYLVPLVFYLFMSGIFMNIMPNMKETLIPSMVVFGGTMGAMIGSPSPMIDIFASDIKKSYITGNIPLSSVIVTNFLSAFLHLFLMCCIITFSAPIIFNAALPTSPSFWVGLILFLVSSIAIATILGVFIKESSKAGMLGQIIFLPTVMISGIMIPESMLPNFVTIVNKALPGTWGFQLMNATSITGEAVLILVIITIVALTISFAKANKSY